MSQGIQLFVYSVRDPAETGLDPNGHAKAMNEPIAYLETEDIQDRLQAFL